MAAAQTFHDQTEVVAQLVSRLTLRTMNHIAEEAKMDGEGLKEATERYDIDYAWFVLGSERMKDEAVTVLEARLKHAATDVQKARVAAILQSAAAAQAPDMLMSFDNDVAESLADRLCVDWGVGATA